MKRINIMISLLYSILLIFSHCSKNDNALRVKAPYRGQELPGTNPEVFAPGVVSTTDFIEMGCTWMPDGRELYFGRSETSDISSNWAIWITREWDGEWTDPEVASFSGVYRDFAPFITPDGKHMLFFRQSAKDAEVRQGTWIVERTGDTWGEPRFFVDAYCVVTADFQTFYFTTESREVTSKDIAMMSYENGHFSEPQELSGHLNSTEWDGHGWISAEGSYMIYDSSRPGGFDNTDIYVSFRSKDGSWSEGFNLGESINKGHHHIPSLSPDGKYIFFAKNNDIYWADAKIIRRLINENQ